MPGHISDQFVTEVAACGDVARVVFADGVRVMRVGGMVRTVYPDGRECGNWPPDDDGSYARLAASLGMTPEDYNFEHELCHVLVPRVMFVEEGYVSRMAARERKMSLAGAKAEERLIWYVQLLAYEYRNLGGHFPDSDVARAAAVLQCVLDRLAASGAAAVQAGAAPRATRAAG